MSIRTTNSELKKNYSSFVWLYEPYTMLQYENAFCHTIGLYGVNYQAYIVPNDRWQGTVILCGDRAKGIKVKSDYKLEELFNNKIKEYLSSVILSDDMRKQFVRDMLVAFVTGINTNKSVNDFDELTKEVFKTYKI